MWILLMIIFSQPYEINKINIIGEFKKKSVCVSEQNRAVEVYNKSNTARVSFGCIKIEGAKHMNNVSHETLRR